MVFSQSETIGYQPIFSLVIDIVFFLDYLLLFHLLNVAHLEVSNVYNFLICEQKSCGFRKGEFMFYFLYQHM